MESIPVLKNVRKVKFQGLSLKQLVSKALREALERCTHGHQSL